MSDQHTICMNTVELAVRCFQTNFGRTAGRQYDILQEYSQAFK